MSHMWAAACFTLLAAGSLACLTATHPSRTRDILTDAGYYTAALACIGYLLTR